jgi:hypothetical protein
VETKSKERAAAKLACEAEGADICAALRPWIGRGAASESKAAVIARSASDEAIQNPRMAAMSRILHHACLDCFAPLAMTKDEGGSLAPPSPLYFFSSFAKFAAMRCSR